jgi:hypothetical protein
MNTFPDDDPQLFLAVPLALCNGRFGPLNSFFDEQAVQVNRTWWRVFVVFCVSTLRRPYDGALDGESPRRTTLTIEYPCRSLIIQLVLPLLVVLSFHG